jgi:pimeloyl-ACP methyl ester carboxylesterase
VRKDEIELHDRGLYIESWLPERRSRRKPLLFVHGELAGSWVWERYLGYFAGAGWEGHALNLRNHHWSRPRIRRRSRSRPTPRTSSRRWTGSGPNAWRRPRDGRPARAEGAERMPIAGSS